MFCELQLSNGALATSAGLPEDDRLSFVHLTTREPGRISATVSALSVIDADALTQIVWALGDEAAQCLESVDAYAFAIRRYGVIEAIEMPGREHVLGVLWHTEEEESSALVGGLVETARGWMAVGS